MNLIGKALIVIWNLLQGKMIWVLLLVAVLLIPFAYGSTLVKTKSDAINNVEKGTDIRNRLEALKNNFSDQTIIIIVNGDTADIVSDQNLAAMKYISDDLKAQYPENVLFTLSPENMIAYLRDFGQIPEGTPLEDVILDENGEVVDRFSDLFFSPRDGAVIIGLWKEIEDDDMADFIDRMRDDIEAANFDDNVQTIVSGFPVVMSYIGQSTPKVLNQAMAIAIVLMALVLAIAFRVQGNILRRWIPLLLVLVSIVFTFGTQGFAGIPLSACSLVAIPILLGMSTDSCVQFHNRYDEETRKGKAADDSARTTLRRTGPPLVMAMLLCCVGFATVFFLNNPQIQYFGFTLIIGCIIAIVVSLILTLGILYLLDKRHDDTRKPQPSRDGIFERVLSRRAPILVKYAPVILIIAVVVSVVGWVVERDIESITGFDRSVRSGLQEYKDMQYVANLAGGINPLDVVIEADDVMDPEILEWLLESQTTLFEKYGTEAGGYIGSVNSLSSVLHDQMGGIPSTADDAWAFVHLLPQDMWVSLVKEDRTALHVSVMVSSDDNRLSVQAQNQMKEVFANPPEGVTATVTGLGILGPYMADSLDDSRRNIQLYGVGFMVLGAFVLFRFNIRRTLAAAIPVLLVLGWSALFMKITGIHVTILMALLPAQMMAIGIEWTLLLLLRYYEERDKGEDPVKAMSTAMARIGRAMAVSGGMVIVGFTSLLFAFNFPFVQDFGIVTIFDTFLCLVACFIILPALVMRFDLTFRDKKAKEHVFQNGSDS